VTQAEYTPAPRITLFQSAGVTVNRVVPLPPDGSFRTNTPDAIGLVRGTSYVVSVGAASERATSIVLLTDLDGHVGQVNVVPARTGLASESVVALARPGAVATTAGLSTASGSLSTTALTHLERSAHDLRDSSASHQASTQAQEVLRTLAPAVQPAAPAAPVKDRPVATVETIAQEVERTPPPAKSVEEAAPAARPVEIVAPGAKLIEVAVPTETVATPRRQDPSATPVEPEQKKDADKGKGNDDRKGPAPAQPSPPAPAAPAPAPAAPAPAPAAPAPIAQEPVSRPAEPAPRPRVDESKSENDDHSGKGNSKDDDKDKDKDRDRGRDNRDDDRKGKKDKKDKD
jgi:hypothetical protein